MCAQMPLGGPKTVLEYRTPYLKYFSSIFSLGANLVPRVFSLEERGPGNEVSWVPRTTSTSIFISSVKSL